jgi:cytochrome d ubiquinol oxidase subunit I
MVGIAFIMLFIVIAGQILRRRDRICSSRWYLTLCQWAMPLGFIAVIAGWTTTEVGRQPWTVYGLLRTADSVTPSLTGGDVALSLVCYALVYLLMFPTGFVFLASIVRKGPAAGNLEAAAVESGLPSGPFEQAARSAHNFKGEDQ